jgi:predicted dehydrogenase
MDFVRFGVIGTGGMGTGHCHNFKKLQEAKLTAVCDIDPQTAQKVGTDLGVPHFLHYKELIASRLCDAVIIATPHPVRPPIAMDCMKAGLHVLSEKPLSERVSTADKMIQTARKTKVAFAVMFQRRTEPAFIKALELVRSGALGKVHRATLISPEYRSQAYYNSAGWRATWHGEGGGVMMNQAPHILDIFVQLGGRPSMVIGRAETRLHKIEVEDIGEALLTYPGGGSGALYTSTNEIGPGQMIEVFGDKGKLVYRDGTLRFFRYETPISEFTRKNTEMWGMPKQEEVKLEIPQQESGHHLIVKNFARHILHGEPLLSPGEDGLAPLELANAVWLSSYLKKAVKLPLSRKAYDNFLAAKRRKFKPPKASVPAQRVTDPRFGK